jgi:cell wall-associated NlpC family hydrolase
VITLNAITLIASDVKDENEKDIQKKINLSKENNIRRLPFSAELFVEDTKNGKRYSFINNKPNGWNNLKNLDSLYGLVCSDVLNKEIADKANRKKDDFKEIDAWVKSEVLYLREGPLDEYNVLDKLVIGEKVLLIDEVENTKKALWYKIKSPNGKTGWAYSKNISKTEVEKSLTNPSDYAKAEGKSVIDIAKKYLGYPYVAGGSSPSGFDCSGFTYFVYSQKGIKIPRTGDDLSNFGSFVSISNLIPGDVVCFQNSSGRVYHVGLYIGDNKFIHAENPRTDVTISYLNSAGYVGKFKCGRRIIK